MPPKRVPGVSYVDVRAYWKRYGCSPGPCYPIPDSIYYTFSNEDVGFIPSPGLVTLKVWIDHIAAEILLIEQQRKGYELPSLDLNIVHTSGMMAAWDAYNARMSDMDKRFNELFDARCNAWNAYHAQHDQEFQVYLNQTYPNRHN